MGIGGQSSGDFRPSTSALRILYSFVKDTIMSLSADGFTQNNPNNFTTYPSSTIPVNVKKGVLGGSVAFTRPDVGPNAVGGPVLVSSAFVVGMRPVGLFINDSAGNAYENTPGPASGKGPYLRGGSCGNKLLETQVQQTYPHALPAGSPAAAGTTLTYTEGQFLYASVNGYLTNLWYDTPEALWISTAALGSGAAGIAVEPDVTRLGILIAPPDAIANEMFLALVPL